MKIIEERQLFDNDYPFISIIVLNYNSKKYLNDCLNSLSDINYPKYKYEVILADNASSDDSVKWVQENYPWVTTVEFDKNYGYAGGNNKAVDSAKGEYVLFLNPDTVVDENWLIELAKTVLNSSDDVVSYASKVMFMDNPSIIQTTGLIMTPIGNGYSIGFGRDDSDMFNKSKYITSPEGCSFLIKKSVFIDLGGFDQDYFAYVEELDLSYRAWLSGFKAIYVPTSILYHKVGGNWGNIGTPFRIFYSQKNRLATILKNFELHNAIKGLVISLLFDVVRLGMFLVKGNLKGAIAILKGNYYFIRNIPQVIKKRKIIQIGRKMSDDKMYKKGLIAPLRDCVREYIYTW